jgi:hypothetical protein
MGLAEKRWAAERKSKDEPTFVGEVTKTLGFAVPVEIDWDAFSQDLSESSYIMNDGYGLPNLTKALATITVDDLGRTAIKEALKKIVIQSVGADASSFTFEGGVITWKAYFGATSSGYIYADTMQATLEKAL